MNVSSTPVQVPVSASAVAEVQNLGPDLLFVGDSAAVSASTGIQVPVGGLYTEPRSYGGPLFMVSDGTSDVRVKAG